jgi:hypothetical protein
VLASGFSSGVSPVGWVLVLPDQTAPNYPPKRRDGVLAVEGHMMIIFGGYSAITGGYLNDVRTAAGGNARARAHRGSVCASGRVSRARALPRRVGFSGGA